MTFPRFSPRLKLSVLTLVLAGLWSALFAQPDYEIKLNRPVKPGDRFKVSARGRKSEETEISRPHEQAKTTKEDFTVEYAATRTVLAVDSLGRPTKLSDVIERLSVSQGGNLVEPARSGSRLIAFTEGIKKIFEIDGRRIDDEQTIKALKLVIDVHTGGPSDDDAFGTKARRRVGESWNMNTTLVVQDTARRFNLELRDLVGKVTLESITHEPTGDILKIVCHFKGDARPVWPTVTASSRSLLDATMSMKIPADSSLARTEDSLAENFEFQGMVGPQNGVATSAAIKLRESALAKMTPIKD